MGTKTEAIFRAFSVSGLLVNGFRQRKCKKEVIDIQRLTEGGGNVSKSSNASSRLVASMHLECKFVGTIGSVSESRKWSSVIANAGGICGSTSPGAYGKSIPESKHSLIVSTTFSLAGERNNSSVFIRSDDIHLMSRITSFGVLTGWFSGRRSSGVFNERIGPGSRINLDNLFAKEVYWNSPVILIK